MKYKFAAPLTVGDLTNSVAISELELCSLSFNFEPERSDKGHATLSVVLVHRDSLHKHNIVYQDESALPFWNDLNKSGGIDQKIFDKLIRDKKLPAGDVVG